MWFSSFIHENKHGAWQTPAEYVGALNRLPGGCAVLASKPSRQLQPQEISPPPTANLDRSNDRVYENVTGLVRAVIEMSSKIQPAPPEEYVPMVK
ncbi:PTK2, partial [Cervus elaphus hippelaphus]